MSRRGVPRSLADAVRTVRVESEPATLLAAVQSSWRSAAGERVAAEAWPVREREATVTVVCRAATWAQELDLLQAELLGRVNQAIEPRRVEKLRFTVGTDPGGDSV